MRSRRNRLETACRVTAFAVLGWMLGGSLIQAPTRSMERASSTDVASRLAVWTRAPATTTLHGEFVSAPSPWIVDWLAALRHSNHIVMWSGSPPAVVLAAEPLPDPAGGIRVDVAAPAGSLFRLRDDGGLLDSARISALGASVVTPVALGTVVAEFEAQSAAIASPDSANVRAVVVVGGASWEGKFIVSALEERGWPVVARFSVAPGVDVAQGVATTLDTSRVSAVIAIDTLIQSQAAAVERYVRSGGGLVLAGTAGLSSALRALVPGSLGPRTRPALHARDTMRLGSTGFYPVSSLNPGAVSIERRNDGVAVAARRVGAGRVIQVGFDDSWRWRMAGAPGAERAHREWWSRTVGAVAYVPPVAFHESAEANAAPLARLVDRLGPARASASVRASRAPIDKRILIAVIMTLLIVEWGSRRLRGLR